MNPKQDVIKLEKYFTDKPYANTPILKTYEWICFLALLSSVQLSSYLRFSCPDPNAS